MMIGIEQEQSKVIDLYTPDDKRTAAELDINDQGGLTNDSDIYVSTFIFKAPSILRSPMSHSSLIHNIQ